MNSNSTTNTTVTEQVSVPNFDLDLNTVPYNDKHSIIAGSAAQITRGLISMCARISVDKETDSYKKALYPELRKLAESVIKEFMPLLHASSEKEQQVIKFNLFGYNGMVKRDRYGYFPFVNKLRPRTTYEYANFGDYMKVLKQRCEYIINCDIPKRYIEDNEQGAAFSKFRQGVTTFLNFITNSIEQKWTDTVKNARDTAGIILPTKTVNIQEMVVEPNNVVANPDLMPMKLPLVIQNQKKPVGKRLIGKRLGNSVSSKTGYGARRNNL